MTLVSGPVNLNIPLGVDVIHVESAEEMYQAVMARFDKADIVIKTAAVADYRPEQIHDQKMKKQAGDYGNRTSIARKIFYRNLAKRKTINS